MIVKLRRTPGRNQMCPCGSGKKYKKCHGAQRPAPPAEDSGPVILGIRFPVPVAPAAEVQDVPAELDEDDATDAPAKN